jgi:D-amino-acid oxidase
MLRPQVLVIGAGVSGLTTAVCLIEAGFSVRIVAAASSLRTTSAVAGASWGPYMVDDPRVLGWSQQGRVQLEEIADYKPGNGVVMVDGLETSVHAEEPPIWAMEARAFRRCAPGDLPSGYQSGFFYTIPLIEMDPYLHYLLGRLDAHGVSVEIGTVTSLADVADPDRVVVNCSGLGAREIVPDETVFPTRGQLVVVENPGVDYFFQDNTDSEDLTYFLPHRNHVVLGGNAIQHATQLTPVPATRDGIIERCAAIEPKFGRARVIGDLVGLRPTRHAVRVERVERDGRVVIHNYGHGGAGVTLSWGCGREVTRLAELPHGPEPTA